MVAVMVWCWSCCCKEWWWWRQGAVVVMVVEVGMAVMTVVAVMV